MPSDSDVLRFINGTLAAINETAFGAYSATFMSLVIHCIKMFQLVAVVNLNRKRSGQLCLSWYGKPHENMTATVELTEVSYSCARFLYCSALFEFVGRKDSLAINGESLEYQKWEFCFVVILLVAVILVLAIILRLAEISNLLVANKYIFLKYE